MVKIFINHLKILRVGHWPKQIFLIPGFIYAIFIANYLGVNYSNQIIFLNILICVVITNFASSANYCINEYLDSQYDKHHPLKKNRPSVKNEINPIILIVQYLLLSGFALIAAFLINYHFFLTIMIFLISGIIYNVEPFRTKDIRIIDVLTESFNNPIRLFLGYTVFQDNFDVSIYLIISYWFGGAFLMGCKRLSEKIYLKDDDLVKRYRPSISKYSLNSLKLHILIYSFLSLTFLFLFFKNINIFYSFLSLTFILLFLDYYLLSIKLSLDIQTPERLFFNPKYIIKILAFFLILASVILFYEFS
ncbi:UbiA family prenyltransferase [Candidatus Pelagibacter sp.]|nr:UbiA family prenyltransferase [Candidatus Pelagibacter sp.]